MPESEKAIVIRHELNHFRSRHYYWSFFEAMLACVFWFNPVVHILRRRGAYLRELECDRNTVQKVNRYEYSKLLLKTAKSIAGNSGNRFSLLTQGWARKKELKSRIENLMNIKPGMAKTAITAFVAVSVAATVGVTLLYGNMHDENAERDVLTEIIIQ